MSQLFAWGGQSIRISALASFLPKKSQGWSPSEWTAWISLQAKGLSRVFSNTTVQKHQFFGAQLSSQSNYHIHTWPLEKKGSLYLQARKTIILRNNKCEWGRRRACIIEDVEPCRDWAVQSLYSHIKYLTVLFTHRIKLLRRKAHLLSHIFT